MRIKESLENEQCPSQVVFSFLLWEFWLCFLSLLWLSKSRWSFRTPLYKVYPLKHMSVVCFRAEIAEFFFWLEKLINDIFLSTEVIPMHQFFFYETDCVWTRLIAANFPNTIIRREYHFTRSKMTYNPSPKPPLFITTLLIDPVTWFY